MQVLNTIRDYVGLISVHQNRGRSFELMLREAVREYEDLQKMIDAESVNLNRTTEALLSYESLLRGRIGFSKSICPHELLLARNQKILLSGSRDKAKKTLDGIKIQADGQFLICQKIRRDIAAEEAKTGELIDLYKTAKLGFDKAQEGNLEEEVQETFRVFSYDV